MCERLDRTDWVHSHKGQTVCGAQEGDKMSSSNIIDEFLRSTKLTEPNQKKKSVNAVNILKFVIFVAAVIVITCPKMPQILAKPLTTTQ